MSTKYALWLNYDNDKKQYQIPVNPEKITIKVNGKTTTSEIDKLGTLIHKGKRDAKTVSWSSFFPAKWNSQYCACEKKNFRKPAKMHKWIMTLINAKNPLHLVLTGGPMALNIYAVVTSYTSNEEGGDPGTIQYSIELREYRSVTITKYKKPSKKNKKAKKTTTTKKRVSNKEKSKTYTIKSGDCLWNIAKAYYGSGAQYKKIYNANKYVLEKAARSHGFSSSNGGNRIWPGTKLTIP